MSDTTPEPVVDETDWKAEARKWEQRAKGNKTDLDAAKAELDGLREKAARLDEIEEQAKTELQKAQERAEAAEKWRVERETADRTAQEQAARKAELAEIAAELVKGTAVPAEALAGSTREELQAHLDVLKPLIKQPLVLDGQGKTPDNEPSENAAFVNALFSRAD